jgi:hypothetical protein
MSNAELTWRDDSATPTFLHTRRLFHGQLYALSTPCEYTHIYLNAAARLIAVTTLFF